MDKNTAYSLKARVLFVIYAVLCLLFFSCMRFPYNIMKPKLEEALGRAMHAEVSLGNIAGHFPLGIAIDDFRVGGESVAPRLILRPALTSLLMGRLGMVVAIEQAQGRLNCTVKTSFKNPGDPLDLNLKLKEFDIAPLKRLIKGSYEIAGMITGRAELQTERAHFKDSQASFDLVCKDGQFPVNIPSLPLAAIPFATLSFKAEVDKGQFDIKQALVNGNDISGTLTGGVRLGMSAASSELNISGNLKLSQAYRAMLGTPVGQDLRFKLLGPLDRPQFSLQ